MDRSETPLYLSMYCALDKDPTHVKWSEITKTAATISTTRACQTGIVVEQVKNQVLNP